MKKFVEFPIALAEISEFATLKKKLKQKHNLDYELFVDDDGDYIKCNKRVLENTSIDCRYFCSMINGKDYSNCLSFDEVLNEMEQILIIKEL